MKNHWKHQGYSLGVLINFGEISDLLKTDPNISWGSEKCSVEVSGDILSFGIVRRCFEISMKNQWKHQGYSLGVLINFGEISDLLKTDSNIS